MIKSLLSIVWFTATLSAHYSVSSTNTEERQYLSAHGDVTRKTICLQEMMSQN